MKKAMYLIFILFLIASCGSIKNKTNKTFTAEEINVIMTADSTMPMRVFKINKKSDSIVLRTKSVAVKVDPKDVVLQRFVKRLFVTVRDSLSMGVGIAAPQVGVLKNIIWVQRFDKDETPFEVYLNPKIINYSEETQIRKEGCLSIPNRTEILNNRSESIIIEYDMMSGEHKVEIISDFTAVIFQHEIDHLNGILFLDHLKKEVLETN